MYLVLFLFNKMQLITYGDGKEMSQKAHFNSDLIKFKSYLKMTINIQEDRDNFN